MDNWYLYHHYKAENDELFYVGIGCQKNFIRAYSKGSRSSFWHNIVKKHGIKVVISMRNLSKEYASKLEKEIIKKFGRKDLGNGILCNLTDGGDGVCTLNLELRKRINESLKGRKMSEETKKRMSISKIGIKFSDETKQKISNSKKGNNYFLGKKHSSETRKKQSNSKLGEKNPMFKKDVSDETRKKLSEAHSGEKHPMYGKTHTFETKEKMSKKKKGAYNGENNPFFGKTHSKETIEKILATRLKNKQLKNHKNGKTSIISKLT